MGKKALFAIIPIVFGILAIMFTYQSTLPSQQQIQLGNEQVAQASMNVLTACDDLHQQIQTMYVNNGPTAQLDQFIHSSSDSIKACKSSLQSINDSCKSQSSMQACHDSRLNELTDAFSHINP